MCTCILLRGFQTVQTVQTVQQQLAQKDEQLSEAVTQLSEAEHQLQLQGDQIRTLMGQVQQLRADQDHRNPAPGPDGEWFKPVTSVVLRCGRLLRVKVG